MWLSYAIEKMITPAIIIMLPTSRFRVIFSSKKILPNIIIYRYTKDSITAPYFNGIPLNAIIISIMHIKDNPYPIITNRFRYSFIRESRSTLLLFFNNTCENADNIPEKTAIPT